MMILNRISKNLQKENLICIANYTKHKKRCEQIEGVPSENKILAIDNHYFFMMIQADKFGL